MIMRQLIGRTDAMLAFLNELYQTARSGKTFLANEKVRFSTWLGGEVLFGKQLFLREFYFKMMQIIIDQFKLDPETLKDKNPQQTFHPLIFTGTPGIGKSCFAHFLFLHLLRTDVQVVYQKGIEHWYFHKGNWSKIANDQADIRRFLEDSRVWYICDLYKKMGTYVITRTAKTIIITSPKYKWFTDIEKNHGAQTYFLPVWSDKEMAAFIEMQEGGISKKEARGIIEDWGNVPRNLVLRPVRTIEKLCQQISSVKELEATMDAAEVDDLGMPSRLIHLEPNADCKTFHPRICSMKAKTIIYERLVRDDWERFVEYAILNSGEAFEFVVHEVLKKGRKCELRMLRSDGNEEAAVQSLDLKPEAYYEFPTKRDQLQEWKIMYNTYCKPKTPNFPCIDALLLAESGVLFMFQITRAGKHPIKLGPFCDIVKCLRAKNEFERICFIFVLPSTHEEKKKAFSGFTQKGAKPSEWAVVGKLTQYIMYLSKDDLAQRPKGLMAIPPPTQSVSDASTVELLAPESNDTRAEKSGCDGRETEGSTTGTASQ